MVAGSIESETATDRLVVVVLPVFNEELSLPKLFPKIAATMQDADLRYQIVACDDGSSDLSAEILAEYANSYPLTILSHSINRGLGETIRDLFEYAVEITSEDDIIVRLDCDDTHEPEIIISMIAEIDEGCDVVTASRFQQGGGQMGVSAYRAFISRCANIYMRIVFSVPNLREYSCGFRAYRASLIHRAIDFYGNLFIQLMGLGFTCTLEKVIKLHILGARFGEVPFVLRYDQKESSSKMVSSITTIGYLIMGLLYHWPWGGWRRGYRAKLKQLQDHA